ncbi:hypothetical protein HHI36_004534 [Cryptolaemus montrouzieri]|uniref:Uncharacterized protein n=1 Tax=Cryptolaemus montrouzieri TaxID=559131 RepID=A0ABD2NRG5_9CUCU
MGLFRESFPPKLVQLKRGENFAKDSQIAECKNRLGALQVISNYKPELKPIFNYYKKDYQNLLVRKRADLYQDKITSSDNKMKTMWSIHDVIVGKCGARDSPMEGDPKEYQIYGEHYKIV